MDGAISFDSEAVALLCRDYGVERLRLFGSAAVGESDPETSDVDFIVDFLPDRTNMFHDYFGLLEGLAELFDREVDLVVGRSMRNPFFKESALKGAHEVYRA